MAAASMTMDFGALDAERAVDLLADRVRQRLPERGPAGAAVELRRRREQRIVAAGAGERAGTLLVIERARERALGSLLAQHGVLIGRQQRAPFGFGVRDFEMAFRREIVRECGPHREAAPAGEAEADDSGRARAGDQ